VRRRQPVGFRNRLQGKRRLFRFALLKAS